MFKRGGVRGLLDRARMAAGRLPGAELPEPLEPVEVPFFFDPAGADGTYFQPKTDWNAQYYGRRVTSREIIIDRVVSNSASNELRNALSRF